MNQPRIEPVEVWLGRHMTNHDRHQLRKLHKGVARIVRREAARRNGDEPLYYQPKNSGSLSVTTAGGIKAARAKSHWKSSLTYMTDNDVIKDIYSNLPASSNRTETTGIRGFDLVESEEDTRLFITLSNDDLRAEYVAARDRLSELGEYEHPLRSRPASYLLGTIIGQGEMPEAIFDSVDNAVSRLGITALHFHPVSAVLKPSFGFVQPFSRRLAVNATISPTSL